MTFDLNSKRILVTGGTGFLGRHVCDVLRRRGAHPWALGRTDGDLAQSGVVNEVVSRSRPAAVVHLAALCGGIGANRERPADFLAVNALMGLHVLRACVDWHVPRVVLLGSICAYPERPPRIPFVEDDLWAGYPEPTNAPYGIAKRMLLVAAQAYRQQYGLDAVTLFPTNMYGPCDHFEGSENHVIPALIARLVVARQANAPSVTLWGDGTPTREFLHVADAAAAVVRALEVYDAPEPLNLGSGEEVSIKLLANMLVSLTGYEGAVKWDASRPNGQPRRLVDSSRARAALNWQAQVTLYEGLRQTVEWYWCWGRP